MYINLFKRVLDFTLALLGLLVSAPVFLLVAIAIKIESNGPILFKQKRLGKNGQVFEMYKFRSMCVGAENTGSGVYSKKNDFRVTKVGRLIRATSVDELPQLINIIKGEMALIGPRPPLTYHPWPLEEYTTEQKKMFSILPGITGWAQVNGRKEVEWNKRIELNVWYVEHSSFWLDIKIFFLTICKVFIFVNNVNLVETVDKTVKDDALYQVKIKSEEGALK